MAERLCIPEQGPIGSSNQLALSSPGTETPAAEERSCSRRPCIPDQLAVLRLFSVHIRLPNFFAGLLPDVFWSSRVLRALVTMCVASTRVGGFVGPAKDVLE